MIQLGYFGKTIHRGDFVRFNLPKAFITVMDDWLQSVMINGESTYSEKWPDRYQECPGYRFHLSPNIAGELQWSGVIGASTDKVGRRFPFCIAAGLPDSSPPLWIQPAFKEGYSEFSSMLIRIQASDYDFDLLQEELATLSVSLTQSIDARATGHFESTPSSDPGVLSIMTQGAHPGESLAATGSALDVVLRQMYFTHSIWSPLDASPQFTGLLTSGLPDEKAALALFDNKWEHVEAGSLQTPEQALEEQHADATLIPHALHATIAERTGDAEDKDTEHDDDVPEANDWASLEDSEPALPEPEQDTHPIDDETPTLPQPKIEPLELEEDSSTTAPWD
ncbi:MAG: type VI secretion system-associated protein TagF [Granulosicoccus sp.]